MIIKRTSKFTGLHHELDLPVTKEQMHEWDTTWFLPSGRFIQDIFFNLTSSQREFIKLGVTKEEWDEVFEKEDKNGV